MLLRQLQMSACQGILYRALQRLGRPLKGMLPSCAVPFRAEQLMRGCQVSDLELFSTELGRSLEVHGPGLPAFMKDIPIGGCIDRALEQGNASLPAPRDEGQIKGFLIYSFSNTTSMSPNRLKISEWNNKNCFRFPVLH